LSEDRTHILHGLMPLAATLGFTVERWDPEEVQIRTAWRPELCTAGGLLHGGLIMAVADSAGASCAFLNLPTGGATTTVESKTNFLRAVRDGAAMATARPLHIGRSLIVVETEVRDADRRLAAKVTQSQIVLQA
jgi:1,4-dihydroxy-2-naphthoyl-CoA hydrolase